MIQKTCFYFLLFLLIPFLSLAQEAEEEIVIGKKHSIQSEILQQKRPLMVFLPDDYDKEEEKSYPVMYLLDGGGNFHHTTATVNFLAHQNKIPDMIVVGIPNTDDRTRDLTPFAESAKTSFPTSGGADNMLSFIETELMPHIESKYRTQPYKILVGHSFGGLFVTHTLIHHPGIFNAYISISPSLWWGNQELVMEQSKAFFDSQKDLKGHLYMTMGNEGGTMLGGAWKLAALLEEKGPQEFYWEFDRMPEETHGSIPQRSTIKGLEFIFKDWDYRHQREAFEMSGMKAIEAYEQKVKSLYTSLEPNWKVRDFLGLGRTLMDKDQAQNALPIFEKATQLFPESDEVWFEHGQSLARLDRKEAAIKSLKKAYELKPQNFQTVALLKQMGEEVEVPAVQLSAKELKPYAGTYEMENQAILTFTSDGQQLWAEASILPKEALLSMGEHRFFVISKNSTVIFKLEGKEVVGVFVETPGQGFGGKKVE